MGRTFVATHTHTHTHTYTHTHVHTYTRTHIHTYTHTHIHTYNAHTTLHTTTPMCAVCRGRHTNTNRNSNSNTKNMSNRRTTPQHRNFRARAGKLFAPRRGSPADASPTAHMSTVPLHFILPLMRDPASSICLGRFAERVASDKTFAVARETDPWNVHAVPASSRGGWFAFSMAPWSLDFDMAQFFSTANASCVHLAPSFVVLRRPPKNEGPSRIDRCHFPNCLYGVAHTVVVSRTKSAHVFIVDFRQHTSHEFLVPP